MKLINAVGPISLDFWGRGWGIEWRIEGEIQTWIEERMDTLTWGDVEWYGA